MIDNLLRLREPVGWILIAVAAVNIVLAVVRFVLALSGGAVLSAAAQDVALEAMSLTLLLALVAVVIACVFHRPVAGARRLVLAAVFVVTIGTVLTVLGAIIGLPASAGALAVVLEFLGVLLDVVLKVVGMVTLWLIHRGLAAGRIEVGGGPATVLAPDDADGPGEQGPDEVEPTASAPTWTADAAAGSVWTSASEAASGAGPTAFGSAEDGSGWRPVGRPDAGAPELDAGPGSDPVDRT